MSYQGSKGMTANDAAIVFDAETGEVLEKGQRSDEEWESYIRSASAESAIIERGRRWLEFYEHCRTNHGKRGGSHFAIFAKERFGLAAGTAAHWVSLGRNHAELCRNTTKFAPDWSAMYAFGLLSPENKKTLLLSDQKIDQKAIKNLLADQKKAERELQVKQQEAAIAQGTVEYPDGLFHVISIDPPWPYDEGRSAKTYDPNGRRAANPYPEMSLAEIQALKIPAADDCVLWLWTTHKFMRHSFALLDAWGFQDKAILTWVKDRMGLGSWLRSQSEFCIMAVKGRPVINLTNQTTVLNGPLREHSRKPDEFYEMVEALCPGRKLDFFSREGRDGWFQFGNDLEKFDA